MADLGSVGQRAGGFEVRQELEAQIHYKIPDIPGHLRASDENAPDKDQQDGVKGVTDVPQPKKRGEGKKKKRVKNETGHKWPQ